MKKKIIITFITAMIICSLISGTAFAATHDVHDGDTFDLSDDGINLGDIIQIDAGATATLTGTAPENVRVVCESGVNLTIDDVILNCSTDYFCALEFTGGSNFLTLVGISRITSTSRAAGISVGYEISLTINGTGEVTSTSEFWGAGIGSCNNEAGTIIIDSGTVKANAKKGAGIGGGVNFGVENITINGGTIIAISNSGAGIGTGSTGNGGTISINGGDITATSTIDGAGIGGGESTNNQGTITISGGTIKANGNEGAAIGNGAFVDRTWDVNISGGTIFATSNKGAGIGSGRYSNCGDIRISGGNIYASSNAHDIGTGEERSNGTLYISGDADIFLDHNNTCSLSYDNTVYANIIHNEASEVPTRFDVPATWSYPVGSYQVNKAPAFTADTQNTSQTVVAGDNIAPLKASDENGASDIVGYTLTAGSLPAGITFNNDGTFTGVPYDIGIHSMSFEVRDTYGLIDTTTLNLVVSDVVVNVLPENVTLGFGETCAITATTNPIGRTVEYYSSDMSVATVDINTGVVTAQSKQGRVIIEAMSESGSDECVIYVVDKMETAPKPSDPVRAVSVELKDDKGDPMAGVAVSLFSEPQTVMTDSNGMAVFKNVSYNTNDPHTLIIQDFRGMEIGRYNLIFASGAANSATVVGDDINIVFNNTISNTILTFTTREGSVQSIMASVDTKPIVVEKVENPQTGYYGYTIFYILGISIVALAVLARKRRMV